MSVEPTLHCDTDLRRGRLAERGINGIDAVEVSDDGLTLTVFFISGVPEGLRPANLRITGGRRVPGIQVTGITSSPDHDDNDDNDDCIEVVLDRFGDACPYRLCVVEVDERGRPTATPYHGFDPRYSCATFSFTQACPSDLDCASDRSCPPEPRVAAAPRDYLAKDYQTFRRLLLDRMALLLPEWRERHVPDLGLTLIELLSYVADQLSYYQDAVATEAYLDTARLRISVRRHGRLVDYVLGEGTNARAFVVVGVTSAWTVKVDDLWFTTGFPGVPPVGQPLTQDQLAALPPGASQTFLPLVGPGVEKLRFWPGHDEILIYTWGGELCCLATGATSATLVDDPSHPLQLKCGDLLLFEEVLGPRTGRAGDVDRAHRHVVRLTHAEHGYDALGDKAVLEVWWAEEDALPFPLCLSAIGPAPDCSLIENVSVSRGNVLLVDHGRPVHEDLPPVPLGPVQQGCDGPCQPADIVQRAGRFRPRLIWPGLTHAEPLPTAPGFRWAEGCHNLDQGGRRSPTSGTSSAAALLEREPSAAVPTLTLSERPRPYELSSDPGGLVWQAVPDLLGSGPDDHAVVVEMDDDRVAWLRFGDDRLGAEPEPETVFTASYRVGNGVAGNVGAETISYAVLPGHDDRAVWVRNPMPASGGVDPEPVADAKLAIPFAFRAVRERAITAADYAELAQRIGGAAVQSAVADLVWTGTWYEADVALDPRVGTRKRALCAPPGHRLDRTVGAGLEHYRRMGHDLRLIAANLVPILLTLTVCVQPHALDAHVKAALLDLFSAGVRRDGSPGYFHPDRWTFGQAVDVSPIAAAAQDVPGVASVEVTKLARQDKPEADPPPTSGAAATGTLPMRPWEIAVLDPGPGALGGQLTLDIQGGR